MKSIPCYAGVPFTNRAMVGRWPQMIPKECRTCWKTDKRSFTVRWAIPPDAPARPIRIVLRNNAAVFEVERGSIMVTDGIESIFAGPSGAVGVSRRECWITLVDVPAAGVVITVHLVGALPFRSKFLRNPELAPIFEHLQGSPPGIFSLGTRDLERGLVGILPDPGEHLVATRFAHAGFFRFAASIPRALYKPEANQVKPSAGVRASLRQAPGED
jgi:hypothetical protein